MAFPVVGEMGVSEDMIVLVDAAGFGVCWTSSLYLAAGAVLVLIYLIVGKARWLFQNVVSSNGGRKGETRNTIFLLVLLFKSAKQVTCCSYSDYF